MAAEEQSVQCFPSLLRSHRHGPLSKWIVLEHQ